MDSPVQIPFQSFIQLNPKDSLALYLQIVFEFIKAIQMGLLPEGTKLPGTRILCKLFSVNRNTLIKAFQDLESQGFIEIRPNQGTFILSDQKQRADRIPNLNKTATQEPFTFERSLILENPSEISDLPYQFNDGQPDLRLLHTDVLARLYVSRLKRKRHAGGWEKMQWNSHVEFKSNFANLLNLTRGLRISASQILTTSNHETGLYLVSKLLISKNDRVVVASPSYYLANMTLLDAGAQILTIPVDQNGISTHHLKKLCQQQTIRAVYLNSNYHYPTTICLSAKRRVELLDLASSYGFVVIEDDYDFDFHYDNNPILPLAAFNTHANVVYIGSLAKSLPPGFGYGFIVAPEPLIEELQKHRSMLEQGVDVIKEQVLTRWIADGEVHRLAKKNKKIYRERRDVFVALLATLFKDHIRFRIPSRGLAVWIEWLEPFSLMELKKECEKNGLFVPKTILYQAKNLSAMRLGFGHLTIAEMSIALEILQRVQEQLVGKTKMPHLN